LPKELLGIQYLRAIAAIAVVFFHLTVQQHFIHPYWNFSAIEKNLRSGVDLFFVISGFIMVYSTDFGRAIPASIFFKKRLMRIVPLYWSATAAMVLVIAFFPYFVEHSSTLSFWHVIASFLFVPAQHPNAPDFYAPLVFVGWTLNYEMFFYALFAIAMIVAAGSPATLLAATSIPITVLSLVGFFILPDGVLGFYTNPVMLEFVMGMMAAATARIIKARGGAAIVVALALSAMLFLPASDDLWRSFRYGIPAFAAVAAAALIRWPRREVLHTLGDASYSIYLMHFFVLSAFARVWMRVIGPQSDWLTMTSYYLIGSLSAVAMGVMCWRYFERPISQAMKVPREHQVLSAEARRIGT
jgi:peptidoglycan/LPS O-acetylase OafA/YrhL